MLDVMRSALITSAICMAAAWGQDTAAPATGPTHLFYVPAARVNAPFVLTAGLHELSLALPGSLQLQFSLVDNIGRLNAAAVFGPLDFLSFGAGLAHSLVHIGRGTHGIPRWAAPRAGAFVAWAPLHAGPVRIVLAPHSQFGDRVSAGGDIGALWRVGPWWSLIAEAGYSFDFADHLNYLNADGGVRIHPPTVPFLFFDAGVDMEEFAVRPNARPSATAFLDAIFSIALRRPREPGAP